MQQFIFLALEIGLLDLNGIKTDRDRSMCVLLKLFELLSTINLV